MIFTSLECTVCVDSFRGMQFLMTFHLELFLWQEISCDWMCSLSASRKRTLTSLRFPRYVCQSWGELVSLTIFNNWSVSLICCFNCSSTKITIQRLLCTVIKFHEVLHFGQDFFGDLWSRMTIIRPDIGLSIVYWHLNVLIYLYYRVFFFLFFFKSIIYDFSSKFPCLDYTKALGSILGRLFVCLFCSRNTFKNSSKVFLVS